MATFVTFKDTNGGQHAVNPDHVRAIHDHANGNVTISLSAAGQGALVGIVVQLPLDRVVALLEKG